jgi:cytidine deaminase
MTPQQHKQLIAAAMTAQQRAYAPYSNYRVGAALLTSDGEIITGCNVENATYGATICAERTAAVKAISEGYQNFDAIAVVTDNGGSPCGICRQFLYEFSPEMLVIIADKQGQVHEELPLSALLPRGFGPASLYEPN